MASTASAFLQRPHSSIDNQDTRSREISLTFIILVNMNSQQEGFHIDVGCYSPPTTTDATITGANGAQALIHCGSNHPVIITMVHHLIYHWNWKQLRHLFQLRLFIIHQKWNNWGILML